MNNQIMGRDLIDPSEIARLKRTECLVLISGLPPFRSKKYPTNKHKRFKLIVDGGAETFTHDQLLSANKNDFLLSSKNIIDVQVDLSELNACI